MRTRNNRMIHAFTRNIMAKLKNLVFPAKRDCPERRDCIIATSRHGRWYIRQYNREIKQGHGMTRKEAEKKLAQWQDAAKQTPPKQRKPRLPKVLKYYPMVGKRGPLLTRLVSQLDQPYSLPCLCERPTKIYSTSGCTSCWTCGVCGNFGGCDNAEYSVLHEQEAMCQTPKTS